MAEYTKQVQYYSPVPGSKKLSTAPAKEAQALKRLAAVPAGEAVSITFKEETLRSGLGDAGFAELYDRIMPGLEAIEQAVLGHLHRLSAGMGADWVRVSKKELMARTGLSDRRLLKALSGLAEKELIRPLHRDTQGTLYKMYTVNKTMETKEGKHTETAEIPKHAAAPKIAPPREKPLESPINEEAFPGTDKIITIREIATQFFQAAGKRASDTDMDSALAQITYLLEDGFSRDEVLGAAMFLAENFGKKADISKLPYYIHQAINNKE